MHLPRLILFTGLGVSPELLDRQRALPVALERPEWIDPQDDEPLAAYSRRIAATVTVDGNPIFLGGVSLGAMVALEVARHLPSRGVFLIAGALSGDAVAPWLHPVARSTTLLPLWLGRPMLSLSPLVFPVVGVTNPSDRRALNRVLPRASARLFRWGAPAVMNWRVTQMPDAPVHHIHGDRDQIIPVHRTRPDVIVKGAGHLLNLTHPQQVNSFIMERIERTLKNREG